MALALSACGQSEAERAERRYEFLQANGASELELCAAAKKVANAFVDEEQSAEYKLWDVRAELHCNQHRIDALD